MTRHDIQQPWCPPGPGADEDAFRQWHEIEELRQTAEQLVDWLEGYVELAYIAHDALLPGEPTHISPARAWLENTK